MFDSFTQTILEEGSNAAAVVVVLGALMLPTSARQEHNTKVDQRIALAAEVSEKRLWPGEHFHVDIILSLRLPRGTRISREPLCPDNPPDLHIPFLLPDPPAGLKGPDIDALLRPLLTTDTRLPALKINRYTVTQDGTPPRIRFVDPSDQASRPARFLPNRQLRQDNDQRWIEYRLRSRWQARKEGVYTFGPVSFSGQVAVGFDDYQRINQWRQLSFTSEVATVTVATPPRDSYPENFFGAIGSVMTADVTLEPRTCRVGDPLQLILSIGGDVSFDRLQPPRLQDDDTIKNVFRVHDATAQTVRTIDRIEFHYVIRPLTDGAIAFPALHLPWFERAGQFFTNTITRAVPLKVLPAPHVGLHDTSIAPAGFRDPADGWQQISWRDQRNSLRLATLGPAIYLLVMALTALTVMARSWRRQYRRYTAHRELRRRLRRLNPDIPIDLRMLARAIHAACNRFFADILDFDIYPKTPTELWHAIAENCPQAMPPPEARAILEHCYQQCFTEKALAHFDPATDIRRLMQTMSAIPVNRLPKPVANAQYLERRRLPRGPRAAAPIVAGAILVGLLVAPHTGRPPRTDDHTRKHIWQEANTLAAHAQTHADHVAVRDRYHELLEAGAHHAALYYNYGTFCLKTGEWETAVNALRQAATMESLDRDLQHNLELAWRQYRAVTGRISTTDRMLRAVFMLFSRTSTAGRMRMAALIMLAVWLTLAFQYLSKRRCCR